MRGLPSPLEKIGCVGDRRGDVARAATAAADGSPAAAAIPAATAAASRTACAARAEGSGVGGSDCEADGAARAPGGGGSRLSSAARAPAVVGARSLPVAAGGVGGTATARRDQQPRLECPERDAGDRANVGRPAAPGVAALGPSVEACEGGAVRADLDVERGSGRHRERRSVYSRTETAYEAAVAPAVPSDGGHHQRGHTGRHREGLLAAGVAEGLRDRRGLGGGRGGYDQKGSREGEHGRALSGNFHRRLPAARLWSDRLGEPMVLRDQVVGAGCVCPAGVWAGQDSS